MIALDAGNTRIKIGYYDGTGQRVWVRHWDAAQPCDMFGQIVFCQTEQRVLEPQHWCIAPTGYRFQTEAFIQSVRKVRPNDTFETVTYRSISMKFAVPVSEKTGIDRLLGIYAASVLKPDVPVLVADAGSAVTVDLLKDGGYCGGAVVPGFRFLAETFPRISERLPLVEFDAQGIPPYPCRNTEESLVSGIYWTLIGAVRQFAELSSAAMIFLTGGDGEWLYDGLKRYFPAERLVLKPELVLDGIYFSVTAPRTRDTKKYRLE
ncbi:MAG: type III pantothenate kinase [Planctomycetaceae bacterium]|jgi:type III pantothenate kinase|nr:type III pantothenate kinase [Planctomycetaceae bacterium]